MENLANRDYYLILDKSGSMEERDTASGVSRWKYAEESVMAIARKIEEYDPDGIDLIFFSSTFKTHSGVKSNAVSNVFKEHSPMGSTILNPPLQWCFSDYLSKKDKGQAKSNGAMVIVITDGQPQDENQVAKSIVEFTKKLDNGDGEFGIAFFQVGKDVQAKSFLQRLDDNLEKEGAKFDIVDTKTMDELENMGLTEALVAALMD